MPTKLSINLNKIALLRNQRHVGYPSVIEAAKTAIAAGAHGVTVHPRPDERHIRRSDVYELAELLARPEYAHVEFNIEGNPFEDYMSLVRDVRPSQATLVPDAPDAETSDNGWDVVAEETRLRRLIGELKGLGVRVSLFMNPDPDAMARVAAVGADRIELYTGPWAEAYGTDAEDDVLARYVAAAEAAVAAGLAVNAGHDLTTANLPKLRRALPRLDEVSIGHAFTSDALWKGIDGSVKGFLAALADQLRPLVAQR